MPGSGQKKPTFLPVRTLRLSSLSFTLSLSLCFLCFLSRSFSLCFDLDLRILRLSERERERLFGDFPRNLCRLLPPRSSDDVDTAEFVERERDRRRCSAVCNAFMHTSSEVKGNSAKRTIRE
ncbi:hypothetical protein BDR04DRAFT_472902 [Suillus decipiens]|nr:hypothetical protein BDR04DRAFT_472902 [Suillus decipiens]